MDDIFHFIRPGLSFFRRAPVFGKQDIGISAGGPMDRLAVITGNIMLGNSDYAETLEIILPLVLECRKAIIFAVTGARRDCLLEISGKKISLNHGQVYSAPKKSRLHFREPSLGLRTVLSYRLVSGDLKEEEYAGRVRGDFENIFTFPDKESKIRVVKGAEYNRLKNPDQFFSFPWRISPDSNEMGLRLEGGLSPEIDNFHMISDAVADGTVQLTGHGPIILLYHRQTVGGYPRIFNIISSDIDLLAQYDPGRNLSFILVSLEEARSIAELKRQEIERFRSKFN